MRGWIMEHCGIAGWWPVTSRTRSFPIIGKKLAGNFQLLEMKGQIK
jgi:hypothetical protein